MYYTSVYSEVNVLYSLCIVRLMYYTSVYTWANASYISVYS